MKIYERVIQDIKNRRERILRGDINCIPVDLPRFKKFFPGVERGKYYIVTANQKIGKTQQGDWMFMYSPLLYAFRNKDKLALKIIYFTLEMSVEEKMAQAMCFLLYVISEGKVRISTIDLLSTNEERPLPEKVIHILESPLYKEILEFFENHVTFLDSPRNPTGINIFLEELAKNSGKTYTKKVKFTDNKTKEVSDREVFDHYEPNNPNEYRIIIVDHISLISQEQGMTLRESIGKLSSDYFVKLRNRYLYTIVAIQQQAQAQESIENFKLNKLKPTVDGLADNKTTARDANLILGLYSPYRYGIREYEDYDITKMKDNIRFLEIIAGRQGGGGNICPLYFDGAVNYFKELPLPNDKSNMDKVYKLTESLEKVSDSLISLILIKRNESIITWKDWLRKNYQYWRSARIGIKRLKPKRNLFNKLCK